MTWMREETLACADVAQRCLEEPLRAALQEGARWAESGVNHVEVLGRGSSSHAGTLLRYALAQRCNLTVSAAMPWIAGSSRKSATHLLPHAVLVALSQSGGSPDLITYARARAEAGMRIVGIINSPGSALAEVCTAEIALGAGREHAVAATKTTVAAGLIGLGLVAGYQSTAGTDLLEALTCLPERLRSAQACDWSPFGSLIAGARAVFVLGRGPSLGIAKEVALKISEATGVPAFAYSSAEFLHGPMAAVSSQTPVLGLCADPDNFDSVAQALARAAEYGAPTLLAQSGEAAALPLPASQEPYTDALVMLVPAYLAIESAAVALGRNPDRPRGLAKVTQTQ